VTPDARLSAAIEVLEAIDDANTAADSILRAYFRSRRYAGSKDRRAVGNRVFDVIRHRARLDWWIAGAAGNMEPTARLRILASVMILDEETPEGVNSLFHGAAHSPGALSPDEEKLIGNLTGKAMHHDAMPPGVVHEVPDWLDKPFQDQWGENYSAEMTALNSAAPVDVRVNTGRVSRGQARKSLSIDDIKTEPTALSPVGLRLVERARLEETKAFRKGLVEVQDEGSQLVALLCEAKPGMTVVDYCAGAGGKTLALANVMALQGAEPNTGSLVACDVSAKRLSPIDDRLKRAGAQSVRKLVLDDLDAITKLEGTADRVLVDAPCSGIGAWRRHPEARWRLTAERLDQHVEDQKNILAAAAKMVTPGGRLVYATCSLLGQENQQQIATFLEDHPDFKLMPVSEIWARSVGTECPTAGNELLLSPASTNTDGFYCAVMERNAT
jgi:16S rRNA (cytosine967-C5)-methyltransferase